MIGPAHDADTWDRYGAYLETPPFQTLEWNDVETGARGWLVINTLLGGAAGGGTRMRRGVTREEVTYLAKAMQLKFAYSGPPIGGGKSGIDFDPSDSRRVDVLRRWYAAIRPFLATRYGTAGDVGVDEQRDVQPLCAEIGLAHPQEGIARGYLGLDGPAVDAALASMRDGLRQAAPPPYGVEGADLTVSDLVTGYGVMRAALRLQEHRGETLEGVRCIVEGFGSVGAAASLYLARKGARIVGILDVDSGIAAPGGLDPDDVADLIRRRPGRALPDHPLRISGEKRELVYGVPADLFLPAAISGSVDARRIAQLAQAGVRKMVCGANQPFREVRLGETLTAQAADGAFQVIPEIVASLGAARAFHHLMTHPGGSTPEAVFQAVGTRMDEAVDAVMARAGARPRGLMAAAIAIALERMG